MESSNSHSHAQPKLAAYIIYDPSKQWKIENLFAPKLMFRIISDSKTFTNIAILNKQNISKLQTKKGSKKKYLFASIWQHC